MSSLERHSELAPRAAASSRPVDAAAPSIAADLLALTKPRITKLVLVTAGVGFALAAIDQSWTAGRLVLAAALAMAGTALSASGANALNQRFERRRDALMPRTMDRPVPAGRVSPRLAVWFGVACALLGVGTLLLVSPAAALLSAATILLYLFAYTPLKPLSPFATIVGAVPGALPPLIGWTAAAGAASLPFDGLTMLAGWSLFAILFAWQMPHFYAIAWMHRDDYIQADYRVLAAIDETGARTAHASLRWIAVLLPVSIAPALLLPDQLGWLYLTVAVVAGGWFLATSLRFAASPSRPAARRVFIASIVYLPVLLLAMVADAVIFSLL